jgi:hypothetical protein
MAFNYLSIKLLFPLDFRDKGYLLTDYAPGWGSSLPDKILPAALSAITGLAVKFFKYIDIEKASKIAEVIGKIIDAFAVIDFGYSVVRENAINDVNVELGNGSAWAYWERAPLAQPTKSKGIILNIIDVYVGQNIGDKISGEIIISIETDDHVISRNTLWIHDFTVKAYSIAP